MEKWFTFFQPRTICSAPPTFTRAPNRAEFTIAQWFAGLEVRHRFLFFSHRMQIGVRVENVEPDLIEDLDHYYRKLQRRERHREAGFSLVFSPIYVRLTK